ncbi:MAG: hypothetical protein WBM50_25425 [Acidimicrobiales bacterium]
MSPRARWVCLGLAGTYDTFVRPWMLEWGSTPTERSRTLPGDDMTDETMTHHTRAITIHAPPEAIWPWLVQIGDQRGGFYSHDWLERYIGVHYIEGRHSATRIHPELQRLRVGDRIATGSIANVTIDAPVNVLEPNRALVIGTWAFVLQPTDEGHTRLLVREREPSWIRRLAPRRSGMLRAVGGIVDYAIGEPLHFVMTRKMMLGLKSRAENHPMAVAP